MADNLTLPATGSVVATDDVSSVHYPRMKIDLGDNGATIPVIDIAAPTALVPTSQKVIRLTATPTVSTTPAYTAKDAVGGLLTFASAARSSGGSIVIEALSIVDKSQQMPQLDLVLFDRTFTASTDNAIFNPSDADLANVLGVISVVTADWKDFSTNSLATKTGLLFPVLLNGTSLFGQLVTRSTQTFVATTDIIVILHVRQN